LTDYASVLGEALFSLNKLDASKMTEVVAKMKVTYDKNSSSI